MEAKRERYTPNDVGSSPLEWETPRLSEVSTLITNGFVGTATPFYSDNTGVPYLYGTNVRANKIDIDKVRYITHEFHAKQSKTELKAGDLLTVQSGHIGETAVVPKQFEGSNCHALIVTRLKQNRAHPAYISYYLNSEIGRARMRGLEVGSTILHINTKDLKKFRVLLPSLPEQKEIAQILFTWDKAITTTEQLLANSQEQKKALMQQLLTGKKRLLDENGVRFSGEWKRIELGALLDYRQPTPYLVKKAEYDDNFPIPVLTAGKTFILGYTHDESGIYKDTLPCIIFDDFTTDSKFVDFPFKAKSSAMKILTAKNGVSIKFIFESMQMLDFKVGGHQRHWISIYSNLVIAVPTLQEQHAIASVLSSADSEITTLKQKLDALKQEKKALMQQLLTGKRRVKVDDEEAA